METLLTRWLGVRPQERRRTALLFSYLFIATLFVILGRTARDTLFLSRARIEDLPWMYVGIAGATALATGVYGRMLAQRMRLYSLLQGTLVLIVWFLLAVRVLIYLRWPPVYSIFYIGMEVAGSLIVLQFWTFVNEAFDAREAKRLFGVIGSGGIMGAVCGGFAGSLLVGWVGVADLLIVCCVALLTCAFMAVALRRVAGPEAEGVVSGRVRPLGRGLVDSLGHSRYTVLLAIMAVLLTVAVSLIDYDFKRVAQSRFSEADMAALFGVLYGVCGLFSFVFHLFFTGRLLVRVGLLVPLLTLPAALLGGALTLIIWPTSFVPLLFTKGADTTLRYSLYDSVVQLLYIPLPVPLRRRVKAGIDGVVKPMAIAGTGLALLVMQELSLMVLGVVLLGLLGAWLVAALQVRQGYTRALLDSLTLGQRLSAADTTLDDVASVRALVEALRQSEEATVCAALELLPSGQGETWAAHVVPLLGAPRQQVRLAALRYVEREGLGLPPGRAEALLADPDGAVRATAARWLGAHAAEGAVDRLSALLRDPLAQVRATAAVALLELDSPDADRALAALLVMAESPDPGARQWAAWGLGEVGERSGVEARLLVLLGDPDHEVQRAAIEAGGKVRTAAMRGRLLGLLPDRVVGVEAAVALAKYGAEVLPSLLAGLEDPSTDEVFRFHLLQALRGLGGIEVVEALLERLPADPDARFDLLRAAYAILRPQEVRSVQLYRVRAPLMREIEACYQGWAILADLGDGGRWELLRTALVEEIDRARQRVFLLIALVYPSRSVAFLYRAIESEKRVLVANAIEVLEDILDRDLRPYVLGLLDEVPPEERIARVKGQLSLRRRSDKAWLGELIDGPADRWLTVCALRTVGDLGATELRPRVMLVLQSHGDGVIRETALATLLALDARGAESLCRSFEDDPQPLVRHLARARLEGQA